MTPKVKPCPSCLKPPEVFDSPSNGILIQCINRECLKPKRAGTVEEWNALSQADSGGPAFPTGAEMLPNGDRPFNRREYENTDEKCGMSLRDYFAAKAMQAVITDAWRTNEQNNSATYDALAPGIALDAYAIADAMLAARK